MKLDICGTILDVKDYLCLVCDCRNKPFEPLADDYQKNPDPKLWLYVNVTETCNAHCPFCVAACTNKNQKVNPKLFEQMLSRVYPYIRGVSFTGGEPCLDLPLLDKLVGIARRFLPKAEIDIATNGTNFAQLPSLSNYEQITSVHVSRHHWEDKINDEIMGASMITRDEIKHVVSNLHYKGRIVFNCMLDKHGVKNYDDMERYLNFAIDMGVQNNSFIKMMPANDYCRDNAVDTSILMSLMSKNGGVSKTKNGMTKIFQSQKDHEFCMCATGEYRQKDPSAERSFSDDTYFTDISHMTSFYVRCPSGRTTNLCRQLVFTAQNQLQDGFGIDRQIINY